jgi:hypothetical protein
MQIERKKVNLIQKQGGRDLSKKVVGGVNTGERRGSEKGFLIEI